MYLYTKQRATLDAWVVKVRPDGKLDVSLRQPAVQEYIPQKSHINSANYSPYTFTKRATHNVLDLSVLDVSLRQPSNAGMFSAKEPHSLRKRALYM